MKLPRLYAIVDRATLDACGIGVREFARELRDAGVRLVQYRDKMGSPQDVLRAAEEISAVFAGLNAMLLMNDRADLAVLAGWDGVHVGQGDLSVEDARRVLGGRSTFSLGMTERTASALKRVIGVSTHTEEQIRAVEPVYQNREMGHPDIIESGGLGADYVAVGPVFGTSTKRDAEAVVGLEGVRRARALTRKPLVAIGGITRENARSIVDAGADAVAVIGGLLVKGERVGKVAEDFLRILR